MPSDEENSPNDAASFPSQSITSCLEKEISSLQQMSQHTAGKYDYRSSEVGDFAEPCAEYQGLD